MEINQNKFTHTQLRQIPEIHREVFKTLSTEEQQFYFSDKLNKKQKAAFLFMGSEDRADIMSGELSEEELGLRLRYAPTRALRTINKGMVREERSKAIYKAGTICVAIGIALVCTDLFINTYLKNKQFIELSTASSSDKPVLAINKLQALKVDNNHEVVMKKPTTMSQTDYARYVAQPSFKCEPLASLSESFLTESGLPKCKTVGDDIWVVGYTMTNTSSMPVPAIGVVHKGTYVNFDGSKDFGLKTAIFPGLETVNFTMIPYATESAFPELTENAVTE
ncbi:hypothetical protein AWB71_02545 [Caballeronia peredens]|nr:hypothetical protein AWB71_02545 [Caballeronia peredens]